MLHVLVLFKRVALVRYQIIKTPFTITHSSRSPVTWTTLATPYAALIGEVQSEKVSDWGSILHLHMSAAEAFLQIAKSQITLR